MMISRDVLSVLLKEVEVLQGNNLEERYIGGSGVKMDNVVVDTSFVYSYVCFRFESGFTV